MVSYKCPNCGRIYNYGNEGWYQCMNCKYPLKRPEEVSNVKHPELNPMLNDSHVIGTVTNNSKSVPKCPTCQSTNIRKISVLSKAGSVAMWGIFSQKVKKQWHCNNCGSDF